MATKTVMLRITIRRLLRPVSRGSLQSRPLDRNHSYRHRLLSRNRQNNNQAFEPQVMLPARDARDCVAMKSHSAARYQTSERRRATAASETEAPSTPVGG